MAEITVQIVLSALQTMGLLVGIFYYLMTLRNAQKSQHTAEEIKLIQLITQLSSSNHSEEGAKRFIELLNMEWTDYADFEKKYGSDNNPDNWGKRQVVWYTYDTIGLFLKKGLVDRDLLFGDLQFEESVVLWHKFGEIIKEIRKLYNQPFAFCNLEYMAEDCSKYYQEKGLDVTPPDTYWSYVPEQ
jgi:hypothetical protein